MLGGAKFPMSSGRMTVNGRESWSLSYRAPRLLHIPLYIREAAGVRDSKWAASPPSLAGFDGPTHTVSMDEAIRERAVQEWREWWLKAIECELELKTLMSERLRSVGSKRPHRAELIACRARLEEPVGRVLPAVAQALRQPAHGWFRERKAWAARMQLPHNIGTVACDVAHERGVPPRCLKAEVLLLLVEGAWWYHARPSVVLCSVDVARDHALLARPLRESLISGLDARE